MPEKISESKEFGSYQKVGRFNSAEQPFSIAMGHDEELDRNVWIFEGDGAIGRCKGDRKSVKRPCRLRILSEDSEHGNWHVTEAVNGTPMIDLWRHRKRCDWHSVRHNFMELANELGQAITDETLPAELSISQVWIDQTGRIKLVDRPVILDPNSKVVAGGVDRQEDDVHRAANLFNELLRAFTSWHSAPIHVLEFQKEWESRMRAESMGIEPFHWAERELADFADRPSTWRWDDRLGLLSVSFGVELPIYVFTVMATGYLMIIGFSLPAWLIGTITMVLGLTAATLNGFFFEGGVAMKISQVQVCRRRIYEAASRVRCGLRNLFVWAPYVMFFTCIVLVMKIVFASEQPNAPEVVDGLTVSAMGVASDQVSMDIIPVLFGLLISSCTLAVGFIWALCWPARAIPDLIVGTELIRK